MPPPFIKNISEIKNCGVFNGWPTGNIIFGRYNLIYGWNGSGKTTLSRVMHSLKRGAIDPALTKDGVSPSFQFQLLDDSAIGSKNLSGWHDKIRVFNCDFVRENINADEAEAQPVYHIGKKQGDALEKLKELREKLEKARKTLGEEEDRQKEVMAAKETALTDCARVISEATGDRKFDKAKLRKGLDKINQDGLDGFSLILNEAEIKAALNTATGNNDKTRMEVLSFTPQKTADSIHAAAKKACDTSVTKATLEELDANTKLRKWTEEGLLLHKDRDTCAFCKSKIEDDRIAILNLYFNDAYKNLMDSLSAEQSSIRTLITEIEEIRPPDDSRVYQEMREQYRTDAALLTDAAVSFVMSCREIDTALTDKKSKLTAATPVISIKSLQERAEALTVAISKLNQTIATHNDKCDNFESAVEEARSQLISHYGASHYVNYKASLDMLDTIDKKISPLGGSIGKLQEEEAVLDAQLREHDIAVDRINELLASFLGRNDIKLITSEKGYYIEREGERAKHLSEGERTAIALTYFFAKMEEKEFDVENSVIVVDDPISSLDTNALYAAGSFIRCHLERASQVFILTHNYYFFREILGWIRGIKTPDKGEWHESLPYKAHIMLRCEVNAAGRRESKPYKLDETLKNYDSEYLFLFKQLHGARGNVKFTENATSEEISKLALLPNVARRVLETFILFKFPDIATGSVINLYKSIKPLEVQVPPEKISILDRLLNRASHGSEDSVATINIFNLSETPKVIEYVLDFIEQADPLHYSGLERAIGFRDSSTSKVNVSGEKMSKEEKLALSESF